MEKLINKIITIATMIIVSVGALLFGVAVLLGLASSIKVMWNFYFRWCKLKRSTFNYIKDILEDYPRIEAHIKRREEELRYPYRPNDLNSDIKSGGANNDQMDNMLITIAQDNKLAQLERNRRVISDLLDIADSDTCTIITELYTKKYPKYTMQGLVDSKLIYCSRSQAFKLRDKFFSLVAEQLNLDI